MMSSNQTQGVPGLVDCFRFLVTACFALETPHSELATKAAGLLSLPSLQLMQGRACDSTKCAASAGQSRAPQPFI